MTDRASGPEQIWRAALAEGRFLLQRGRASGAHVFPPRVMAPGDGGALDWVEASGLGNVYSVTQIAPKPPAAPYNVVLIDLDEGARVMSRIEGLAPDDVKIGLRVKARIGQSDDGAILLFDPA